MYKVQVFSKAGGDEIETITTRGFRTAKLIGLMLADEWLAVKVTHCDDETGEEISVKNIWVEP